MGYPLSEASTPWVCKCSFACGLGIQKIFKHLRLLLHLLRMFKKGVALALWLRLSPCLSATRQPLRIRLREPPSEPLSGGFLGGSLGGSKGGFLLAAGD